MGAKAEELGVEIYPGFSANEVLWLTLTLWFDVLSNINAHK